MSLKKGVVMTFSKRMMFLNIFLVALAASALLLSCDLGTNSDDDNVLLQSARSTVVSDEAGTYTGTLEVQMGPDLIEFDITLVLDGEGGFEYDSVSVRGDAELEGDYELDRNGTLTLYDTGRILSGKVYYYVEGDPSTISGDWYLGDAPGHVFWPATLTKE
jgi:hypothetical protein